MKPRFEVTDGHVISAVALVIVGIVLAGAMAGARITDQAAAACEARVGYAYLRAHNGYRCVQVLERDTR